MSTSYDISIWSYRAELMDHGDISGYAIHARDGDIGKVDKHDVDAGRNYLLVATGPWIFGKTVMLPAGVIDRIDHEDKAVYVSASKDEIKNAPEFEADEHGDDEYQDRIGGYYGGLSG